MTISSAWEGKKTKNKIEDMCEMIHDVGSAWWYEKCQLSTVNKDDKKIIDKN